MLIPFGYGPTPEQRRRNKIRNLNKTAEHLCTRMQMFLNDLQKEKIGQGEKTAIREKALKFLEQLNTKTK